MEGDERIVNQLLINFGPDHLKILWETTITSPKLSCMLGVELPPALSALQVLCVSCFCHTPKYCLFLLWDDWKETKFCVVCY